MWVSRKADLAIATIVMDSRPSHPMGARHIRAASRPNKPMVAPRKAMSTNSMGQ
jgi:hypothetical protein